jgi:hypothetical protein
LSFDTFAWMRAVVAAQLPATAKGVAHALALRSDQDGRCWPSLETIAIDAGLSVAGARLALRALTSNGVVSIVSGSKGRVANRYELQPLTSWTVNPSPRDRSPRNGSPRVVLAPPNPSPGSAEPLTSEGVNPSPGSKELPNRTTQELPKGIAPVSTDAPKPKLVKAPASGVQQAVPADHVGLQRHYAAAFRRETGADHVLARGQGSRHGRALQDLLAACRGDFAEACGVIDRALADPWQRGKRPELWNIVADVNKFRGSVAIVPARGAPGSNFERLRARAERIAAEEKRNAAE